MKYFSFFFHSRFLNFTRKNILQIALTISINNNKKKNWSIHQKLIRHFFQLLKILLLLFFFYKISSELSRRFSSTQIRVTDRITFESFTRFMRFVSRARY